MNILVAKSLLNHNLKSDFFFPLGKIFKLNFSSVSGDIIQSFEKINIQVKHCFEKCQLCTLF